MRPLRFAAWAWPFTRRISTALSTSPPASVRAALQSIIPAPVRSRRAFTSLALISTVSTVMALVTASRKEVSLPGLVSVPELAALSMIARRNCCWWRSRLMSPSGNWYRWRM